MKPFEKGNLTVLNCLKWTQLALAITIAIALGVVFFPSVEVVVLLPLCLLYVLWAIRAIHDRRVSMWLACLASLTVAVLLGALTVSGGFRAFQAADTNSTAPLLVAAILLFLLTLGAWIVVVMHAFHWRWLVSGKATWK